MAPTHLPSVTVSHDPRLVSPRRDARRTVVWLRGEHDLATVTALSETLARLIELDDCDLVVDLSEVEFMGAATIGVLVRARALLELRSRSLTLRSPSVNARRVLEVCGDTDLLDPCPAEATRLLGSNGPLDRKVGESQGPGGTVTRGR